MEFESPEKNKQKFLEDRNYLQLNLAEYALSKINKSSNVKEDEIGNWLSENSKAFGELFDNDPEINNEYEKIKDKNPDEFYDQLLKKIYLAKVQK